MNRPGTGGVDTVVPDVAVTELEEWVARHQPVVYRAARLILRDGPAAEDVAQETFVRAFRAAGRRPVGDPAPWLYRIAVNLALNRLRSRRREEAALARLEPGGAVDPEDAAVAGTTRSEVAEALGRLPDRLRVPVVLRYYLDLPEREIAAVLGIRPGTTKSRLHQARRLLAADATLVAATEEP